jgi:hypothetical protein
MLKGSGYLKWRGAMLAACALVLLSAPAFAQMHGAVYTTDINGQVNANIYDKKTDVYLNGGPRKEGSAGLPVGLYHVQVTDPSGAVVLGSSWWPDKDVTAPTIEVVPAEGGSGGKFAEVYRLWDIVFYIQGNGANCVKQGYKDSPNNGGVYKVWVSQDPTFPGPETKTDNFKVKKNGPPPPPETLLSAWKFYDFDGDGAWGAEEDPIFGWKIELVNANTDAVVQTQFTDAGGEAQFWVLENSGPYYVREVMADDNLPEYKWEATTDMQSGNFTATGAAMNVFEFGNRALTLVEVNGYGRTKGYWQNPNGYDTLAACGDWWEIINGLCLRWPNGDPFEIEFADSPNHDEAHEQLADWIVGQGALGNPQYIMGTQLAALVLTIHCWVLNEYEDLQVFIDDEYKSLDSLIAQAVALLCEENPTSTDLQDMLDLGEFFDTMNNNQEGKDDYEVIPVFAWQVLPSAGPTPIYS